MRNLSNLVEQVKGLDAQEMEILLYAMGNYFLESADELTNMDAQAIAGCLCKAGDLVSKRSGN